MFTSWIIKKRFWFGLLLFPILFYILPTLSYIPEWDDKKFILFNIVPCIFAVTYIASMIFFWNTPSLISSGKKITLIIITTLTLIVHGVIFFVIIFTSSFSLGKKAVTFKDVVKGRTIYIFHNTGLLDLHIDSQIAYKIKFLPLYKVNYSTKNHLEFKKKGKDWILFNEYENVSVEKEIDDILDLFLKREKKQQHVKDYLLNIDRMK